MTGQNCIAVWTGKEEGWIGREVAHSFTVGAVDRIASTNSTQKETPDILTLAECRAELRGRVEEEVGRG